MESYNSGHNQEDSRDLQAVRPFPPPRLLIFDLDGTLIDSKQDLIGSVNASRAHMQMARLPDDLIASYVGNGAPVLIRRAMGADASDATVETALDFFIRHYHEHCLDETRLYPGVLETIEAARDKGIQLGVLTNKPVGISNVIVDGLGLNGVFFRVYGGNSFATKKPDPLGLTTLHTEASIDARETVMVGDSSVDIQTARNAGVYSVGLTYGLQPESLITTPPDLLLDRMEDLIAHL